MWSSVAAACAPAVKAWLVMMIALFAPTFWRTCCKSSTSP
jgi:hypothetical protein